MRNRRLAPLLAALLAISTGPVQTASAQPSCDPFQTTPVVDPSIPTAQSVFGFDFGAQEVTVDQSNAYLAAVDAASTRVVTATAATSVQGRHIDYAIVGTPARIGNLAAVRSAVATLQDPDASAPDVAAALASAPAILWVAANVHGGEESGADASLMALYNLAARSDCVVNDILANAVVVLMPIQNPDGRELETRRNANGFDMNRDWFARTQPETDGKIEVVRQYPPMLFIDAHEFGYPTYFFPPNADPEYHETPTVAHDWINGLYSPAIVNEFNREKIKFFHGAPYDFFAPIFGDTVPAVGFHAAGMTFEKADGDAIAVRTHEHFTSIWASLFAGATNRAAVLQGWHDSWVEAKDQGENGELEGNAVFEPRHDLYQDVPDVTVRSYFIAPNPDKVFEVQTLVRRLQRMDVDVYQLTSSLSVDHFHPYADGTSGGADLESGTYWIPLAQGQKHWIQAMLNEETWIPFDVTYDVTAWSNPLLMNLAGGWTPDDVSPAAALVAPLGAPGWTPTTSTGVGLFEIPSSTRGFESAGQARWLFNEVWHLDFTDVTAADITAGLAGIDVLVIPDGYANYGLQALGAKGKKALRDWVNAGGRLVAWQGGAVIAAKSGASTAKFSGSHTNMPGTLVRVSLDPSSPLAAGVGDQNWVLYQDDSRMQPGLGTAVSTFPAFSDPDYATSGLAIGVETLAGSSVVSDEAVGAGRVISFSIDPNFRGWTQGTQRLLWNAIAGPDPAGFGPGLLAGSKARAAAEKAALDAASQLPDVGSAIRIRVARSDAAATAKILARRSSEVVRIDLGNQTLFLVANKKDLSAEESAIFGLAVRELEQAGIEIIAASVP